MYDLVIRGGTVVDGHGDTPYRADVAITGDRIVAVGPGLDAGTREIDATGQIVTPGWVDIHTHYDGQVTWDEHLSPSGWHGVTTAVMGNCGVGFAPVRPGNQDFLIQLMEGVEDIPGTALAEGMSWEWESFAEYLDAVDAQPRSMDVAAQVAHGPVRAYVMGQRGADNEIATDDDIAEMATVVEDALAAGALGFSTSRTWLHRATNGEVVPGTRASEAELMGIAAALGHAGHGVFQVASDLTPEDDEIAWMKRITRETGRPVAFSLLQNNLEPDQWRRMLTECEQVASEGGHLTAMVAQRPAGVLFGFESTIHPFVFFSGYQAIAHLAPAERRVQLADPAVRASILDNPPDMEGFTGLIALVARGFSRQYPLGDPPEYEPGPERSIAAIAEREGRSPFEVAYDVMMEGGGTGFIYLPFLDYVQGNLDNTRELMLHPQSVFGLSDGGAHCGLICDASVPSFLLTHWVRDRSRGERIPIETVVASQTRDTAMFYGLEDRGVLAAGMKADVNVIDLDGLHIYAPRMVYDLPAGGRRLIQEVDGYSYTICSGEITYDHGTPTGALPGHLVRGPQTVSA
ncbi:MAG: amidohydrolase family protein [Acidimicrobiia bacterium]|nr:amidohydrolase family protein [Acidimicrobiia bacterium]